MKKSEHDSKGFKMKWKCENEHGQKWIMDHLILDLGVLWLTLVNYLTLVNSWPKSIVVSLGFFPWCMVYRLVTNDLDEWMTMNFNDRDLNLPKWNNETWIKWTMRPWSQWNMKANMPWINHATPWVRVQLGQNHNAK